MREIKEVFPYHSPDDHGSDDGDDAYHYDDAYHDDDDGGR